MKKLLAITAAAAFAFSALAWTQLNAIPTPAQNTTGSGGKVTVSVYLLSTETNTNLTDETTNQYILCGG